jgi:hypothetical protein
MRKQFLVLVTIVMVITSSLFVVVTKSKDKDTALRAKSITKQARQKPDPPGTISGANNPALIPDDVAYSMLFRLISGPRSEAEKLRIKDRIRQMGLGKQQCANCPRSDEADITAVSG